MLVGALVVAERALPGGVVDVPLGERHSLRPRRLPGELDGRERGAGVAAGAAGDQRDDLLVERGLDRGGAAAHDLGELLLGERLELDDLAAGEEGGVDLEVGVLRRGADQRHEALLDRGQERVLLRLVEAVDLVEEEDRPLPVAAQPVAGALHHAADVVDPGRDGRELLECGAGLVGDDAGERRLPRPGRAVQDQRAQAVILDRAPQRRALAEHVLLPDQLVERARADSLRHGASAAERSRAASAKRSLITPVCSARGDARGLLRADPRGRGRERLRALPEHGRAARLQKTADEWVHRDELLFQTVHQSSELWLKLAWNDVEAATAHLGDGEIAAALRLLRRSALCLRYATTQLDMLEQMSPWEYQEIRKVLGHGSGFDSPGWRELRRVTPRSARRSTRCASGRASRSRTSTCRGASTRSSTSSPRR